MADPFLGEIRMFGFKYAPRDWAFCAGQIMGISQNTALFALLGVNFGGNGQTTFNLPDLQGRLPMGQGNGAGLSQRTLGQQIGSESVTLLPTQCAVPPHSHTLAASNTAADQLTQTPANGWTLGAAASNTGGRPPTVVPVQMYGPANPSAPVQSAPTSQAVGPAAAPVNLVNPALVLNFCIALNGIFPPQS